MPRQASAVLNDTHVSINLPPPVGTVSTPARRGRKPKITDPKELKALIKEAKAELRIKARETKAALRAHTQAEKAESKQTAVLEKLETQLAELTA